MSKEHGLLRNLPKIAVGSASLLAALYLGLSPRLSPALYTKRIFRPFPYPEGNWDTEELAGIKRLDCEFTAVDGSLLHGWLFEQPTSDKVILFSHGNTGNLTGRTNTVELLLRAGASVFIYDYRGYGKSEGTPSVRGICEDGVAAFDYLMRGRGYKPSQIVLYGESLGTAVSCEVAAERPCAGVILQSGFVSLRKIGSQMMPITKIYPQFLFPRPLLDCALRMEKDPRPLLVIHGGKDEVIPFAHAQELHARAAEPKAMVHLPECGHSDIWCLAPEVFVNAVRDFLQVVDKHAAAK